MLHLGNRTGGSSIPGRMMREQENGLRCYESYQKQHNGYTCIDLFDSQLSEYFCID